MNRNITIWEFCLCVDGSGEAMNSFGSLLCVYK